MNAENGPSIIWGVVMVVMLVSSLAARRLPIGQLAKMILAWVAIFAALFAVFSFRSEFKAVWHRVSADVMGTANQSVSGSTVMVKRRDDGHFWVRTQVNGHGEDFLIDSGATITAISSDTAKAVGADVDANGYPIMIDTANGSVMAKRGTIGMLQIETIKIKDLPITVSDNLGDANLLGMNFLDQLGNWKVEGDVMTLQP